MKDKIEFESKVIKELKNMGYIVYNEHRMKGSRRRPDLLAIRDKNILIIETKSFSESKDNSWLSTYKGDYLPECRKVCKSLVSRVGVYAAKWMGVIGGQLQYYIKTIGEWNLEGIDLEKYNIIPSLIAPKKTKRDILKAIKELRIKDYQIIDFSIDAFLIKLNKNELLKISW